MEVQGRRGDVSRRRAATQQDPDHHVQPDDPSDPAVRDQGRDLVSGRVEREQRAAGKARIAASSRRSSRVGAREFSSGREALPFFWVQLPNYNHAEAVPPTQAGWATIRESMRGRARAPEHRTGRDHRPRRKAPDLHPRNKQDVGARLARVVRKVAYHQTVIASGPTYRSHTIAAIRSW